MTDYCKDLEYIKETMEKATKFRSVNGLGVFGAGLVASLGSAFLWRLMRKEFGFAHETWQPLVQTIFLTLAAILVLAVLIIAVSSWRTAKANGENVFGKTAGHTLYNFLLPLAVGAVVALFFLYCGRVRFAFLFSLIFYGLALVNASKFTFNELHWLGLCEIATGLAGMLSMGRRIFRWADSYVHVVAATLDSVLWWATGFGLLHIVFGLWIYFKYNRKTAAK
ncbi:MAG: hypothetical protein LBR64_03210 [Dysgonamonadaceae bacterium]|jgi:hypothetical protein|nr:hypothetical protein [Dysgonamonadaceae bacterium]